MNNLYYFLKLIRINNIIIASLVVLLSAYLLPSYNNLATMQSILIVALTMAFGYIMNDLDDLNSDIVNHPNRVLVNKHISIPIAQLLCCFCLACAIVLTYYINFQSKIIYYFCIVPLLILYNKYLKKLPLIGNIIISLLLGITFIFTELVAMSSAQNLLVPAILAFNLSLIREILKDLHDYSGDLKVSMKTLPILIGIKQTCNFLIVYIFLCCVGFLLPFYFKIYSYKYLISLIFFIEIPLIYSLLLLSRSQTIKTFKKMIFLYKLLIIFGLFVILSTKF